MSKSMNGWDTTVRIVLSLARSRLITSSRGWAVFVDRKKNEGIGVRPTQLTISGPALQKFRPGYDLFQNLHEC